MPTKGEAWQRMLSGRRLNLLDPSAFDIEIEDIAHGLAKVARWNGQTKGDHAFSVAQHSLLVLQLMDQEAGPWPRKVRLGALLHDAAEYVIGDLISPFKRAINLEYKTFELQILAAIRLRFGLDGTMTKAEERAIKQADNQAAYLEATQLAGFSNEEAAKLFAVPGKIPPLSPLPPMQAKAAFLDAFNALGAKA